MSLLLNIPFRTVSKSPLVDDGYYDPRKKDIRANLVRVQIQEWQEMRQVPCLALSLCAPVGTHMRLDRFVLGVFRACICSPRYKQDTLRSRGRLYHLHSLQVCVL